jgi:hypothetical protein
MKVVLMSYLDKAKALMKEAGIDRAKSVTSALSLPETKPFTERYRLKYPEGQASRQELAEIETRVHKEGFVLLWSTLLQDLVSFYRDEADKANIPPGFVPYSLQELTELFGSKKRHSLDKLRLVHEAKKTGGAKVISCE